MRKYDVSIVFLVTTKVTQGAKTFGSFLYSAVNKAGAKIKETVKDNVNYKSLNASSVIMIKICFF